MQFKTDDLREEYYVSNRVHPKLYDLMSSLYRFCATNGLPNPIVTAILDNGKPPTGSNGHHWGEAIDIRLQDRYTAEQMAKMLNFVRKNHWRQDCFEGGRQKLSFYPHGRGDNFHAHLSVDIDFDHRRKIKEI